MDSVIQKLVEELKSRLVDLAYLTYLVRVSTDALMWLLTYKRCDSDITCFLRPNLIYMYASTIDTVQELDTLSPFSLFSLFTKNQNLRL